MFIEIFKDLLAENYMNMRQFSLQSGIPYPTVVGWMKLNRLPDFTALMKIADFFQCSVDFLMGRINGDEELNRPVLSEKEKKMLECFRRLSQEDRISLEKITLSLYEKEMKIQILEKEA